MWTQKQLVVLWAIFSIDASGDVTCLLQTALHSKRWFTRQTTGLWTIGLVIFALLHCLCFALQCFTYSPFLYASLLLVRVTGCASDTDFTFGCGCGWKFCRRKNIGWLLGGRNKPWLSFQPACWLAVFISFEIEVINQSTNSTNWFRLLLGDEYWGQFLCYVVCTFDCYPDFGSGICCVCGCEALF